MTIDIVETFTDNDEKFWRCKTCRRVGKEGWAHACNGQHWYPSVAALRAALEASHLPPGTIVVGGRSPSRGRGRP